MLGTSLFYTASSPAAFVNYTFTISDINADALRPWRTAYSYYRVKRISMHIRPLFQRPQVDPYSEQQALTDSWVNSECPLMWRKYRTSQEGAEQKGPPSTYPGIIRPNEYIRFREDNGTRVLSGYKSHWISIIPCINSAMLQAAPAVTTTINSPVYNKWLPLTFGEAESVTYYGLQILPDASNNIGYEINSSVSGTANTVARLAQRWTVQPYVTVEFKNYKSALDTS